MNYGFIVESDIDDYYFLGKKVSNYVSESLGSIDKIIKDFSEIEESGCCVIIGSNMPFISKELIDDIITKHRNNNICNLTMVCGENDRFCGYKELKENDFDLVKFINNKSSMGRIVCVSNKLIKKIKNKKVIISYYKCEDKKLLCVNNLFDLNKLEEVMRLDIINTHISNGVRIEGVNNTYISKDVLIEEGSVIIGSRLLGNTKICKNSIIDNSYIENSYVDENNFIFYSVIKDSKIGKNSDIGPFTHIRMNSNICGNNRIGNFVEIKKSKVGLDSKLSHLSYMGDCECGKNVNFGCGSITVNYDGKNKYKTIIEDNSFIGCNSNLVAPIKIGENSFIGAGSTITDDVDEDSLAIARAYQINKKGYMKNE